jgi:SH3-like domain-containing protein
MRLPTFIVALLAVATGPLGAQRTLTRSVELHAVPGARPVAQLRQGIPVRTGATRAGHTEITVEGWVSASFVAGRRERFPISIRLSAEDVRLRSGPGTNNRILAEMRGGMGLTEISRRRGWVHVRRTGWVPTAALSQVVAQRENPPASNRSTAAGTVAVEPPATAPATPPPTRPAAVPPQQVLTPNASIALRRAPEEDATATLEPGARVMPLARERGWVRVQVEGWVRESELVPADTSVRASLSAADLRSNPDGTRGQLVHWQVQVLSLQRADVLRRGMELDEPYLLARGPGSENAILYLAVPESLLETASALPSLTEVTIVARVRTGRSEPAGVPILEVQSLARVP